MSEEKTIPLTDALEDDDWAIIIGKEGDLKGIFIPEGKDEDVVPDSIVEIMATYFGVDFDEDAPTLH